MSSLANLEGKKGLVVGIANDQSIAYGCAQQFRSLGAELAITYLNERAEPHVRPLAEALQSPLVLPCDVQQPGQLDAVFEAIRAAWGRLDFVLHSIAFAPKADLHGRLTDCSAEGFGVAMHISCHSFIQMARLAEPLMQEGGCLLTLSYLGAERVVPNYGVMGPVKAALESSVRYLAAELGKQGIRVHAISPGPMRTRAASGIAGFEEMLAQAERQAPTGRLATPADIGALASFLVSDAANAMTGDIHYVDGGAHILS
jgi:enoyl-[acyl-carrier protein] reductase I